MSKSNPTDYPISQALPLLQLGGTIHDLHLKRYPSQRGAFHFCNENIGELRVRIRQEEVLAEFVLLADNAPDRLKAAIRARRPATDDGKEQKDLTYQTYVLALIAYSYFSTIFWDRSADGIVRGAGVAISIADPLLGSLKARKALLELISYGVVKLSDNRNVELPDCMIEWITEGNPYLALSPVETALRRLHEKLAPDESQPETETIEHYVKNIPLMTPAEMNTLLSKQGYVGQEKNCRKSVCLAAYRHVKRLRNIFLDEVDPTSLPPRENILLTGNTGCGKTMLCELLFRRILRLPFVLVDMTTFSQTGYVGDNIPTILTRLLLAAHGNLSIAETGIIALDEIDKISGVSGAGTGGGAGGAGGANGNRDVSGYGVQQGLLKMLEGSSLDIPEKLSGNPWREEQVKFHTRNVLFVGLGAFSGFNNLLKDRPNIGFNEKKSAQNIDRIDPFTAQAFQRYGICSELYGRFGTVLRLEDLTRAQLKVILENTVIRKYRSELFHDNIELEIDPAVSDLLVNQCVERGTGARGLSSALSDVMQEAAFDVLSTTGTGRKIALWVDDGNIQWGVSKDIAPKTKKAAAEKEALCQEAPCQDDHQLCG